MKVLRRTLARSWAREPRRALEPAALELATCVDDEIRARGEEALREFAAKWDGLQDKDPLVLERAQMDRSRDLLEPATRTLLERSAQRIERFALAQRESLQPMEIEIEGGRAGHRLEPLQSAGCYAPGGRYPLPSSVLMTVIPARIAGVSEIVVASPRPDRVLQAAASIAGADRVLCAGGAHAISALRHGTGTLPRCEIIVGPGNAFVTAAKYLAAADTSIDMLAGPSELLIVAGRKVDPEMLAADLLAQAEHDPDAMPWLLTESERLLDNVDVALQEQLSTLSTANIARQALRKGGGILAKDLEQAIEVAGRMAPEHLQLMGADVEARAREFRNYGALFIGEASGEVLGDYAAGPNHVLPTGGTARSRGGLSVHDFLAVRSYLQLIPNEASSALAKDAESLARLEGLHGHAAAAARRILR